MEFSELLRLRQSVRHYQQRPVARPLLDKLVEAVRLAPSASNSQPWKLIVGAAWGQISILDIQFK